MKEISIPPASARILDDAKSPAISRKNAVTKILSRGCPLSKISKRLKCLKLYTLFIFSILEEDFMERGFLNLLENISFNLCQFETFITLTYI